VDSQKPFIMTEQRRVILDELQKLRSHPTADELYESVRKRLPSISLGTVYRNLEMLSEAGMIQKLEISGSQKRFDGITRNHYHVRCLKCGRVDDIETGPIADIDKVMKSVHGYKIVSHRLEFVGVCPRCRNEEPQQELSRLSNA
jgi:Fur family transcriptional regulator, ferric uptake regulator